MENLNLSAIIVLIQMLLNFVLVAILLVDNYNLRTKFNDIKFKPKRVYKHRETVSEILKRGKEIT